MNTRFDVPFLTDLSELLHLLRHKSQSNMGTNIFPFQTNTMFGRITYGQQNTQYESWEGKFFTSDSVVLTHPNRVNHRAFTMIFFQSLAPMKLRMNHHCLHDITLDSEGKEGVLFLSSFTNLSIMIPQNAFVQFKVVTIRNIHSLDHWINQWPFGNIVQARMPFFYYWPQRIAFYEKAKLSHIEVFYPNAYQSPLKMLDDLFANAARSRKMKQKAVNLWQMYCLLRAEGLLRNVITMSPHQLKPIIAQSKLSPVLFFLRFKQLFGLEIEQYHEYARNEKIKALLYDLRLPMEEVNNIFYK
ncbi:hypothetical protein [Flectobacillus roseus]|uniref:hypothetical protein n=1 Tax=Flectobacillus roseus TaxID=502259 RepID=UPI0024B6BE79|nr:hypothetical protein [Flectobacillus roseus]MDI9872663.1 hypothetical protein [Flectobacillus roseus]